MQPNKALIECLNPAYSCAEFDGVCAEMHKRECNMPRGFCGAAGSLEEVELVLVFAQPGDPYEGEDPRDLKSAYEYTMNSFRHRNDPFHKNVRKILYECWPTLSTDDKFDELMRKVWLTESVLCSAKNKGGQVPALACRACGRNYLCPQLALLFPKALVVALGSNPKNRLLDLGFSDFFAADRHTAPGHWH